MATQLAVTDTDLSWASLMSLLRLPSLSREARRNTRVLPPSSPARGTSLPSERARRRMQDHGILRRRQKYAAA